jgi:hypothetical protein
MTAERVRLPGTNLGAFTPMSEYRSLPSNQPNFLAQATAAARQANLANKQREMEVRAIYDEMIKRYQPGGTFETKSLEQIEKQKSRYVGQAYGEAIQGDISRGLYGTTESGARRGRLEKGYEADVAQPARLRLEDVLMQRLTSAQQGLAGFITGIEDQGPSLSQLYSMGAQAGSAQPHTYSTIINRDSSPTVPGTSPAPSTPRVYGQSVKGTGVRGVREYDPSYVGRTAGGGISNIKPYAQSFTSTYNYLSKAYNMGYGQLSSQRAAFEKLRSTGWTG